MSKLRYRLTAMAVFSCLLPSVALAGNAYYVDCSQTDPAEDGSYEHPWNSVADVNNANPEDGDDVYFKVGTTCTLDATDSRLAIDWGGVDSNDTAIVGAYFGDGQFGLNGSPRPILDGVGAYPTNDESALVGTIGGHSYVVIKDIRVNNSGGYGIQLHEAAYSQIDNCYAFSSYRVGLLMGRSSYSSISNSIAELSYQWKAPGDCIDVSGGGATGTSHHNTVVGNTVKNCNEGIGIYNKNEYITVENNVLYDNDVYNIYVDVGQHITIRNNLIYTSNSYGGSGPGRGVVVDNETARGYCYGNDDIKIYGNLIAAMTQGIYITNHYGTEVDTDCNTSNVLIYHNTLVDNGINIRVVGADAGWFGNEIKNNISRTKPDGSVHTNDFSPESFTWSHNNFDDPVSGNAAIEARIYDPGVTKIDGWHSLAPGSVNGTEFSLTSGSENRDNGISIVGFDERIVYADYAADVIAVQLADTSPPSIGAWAGDGSGGTGPDGGTEDGSGGGGVGGTGGAGGSYADASVSGDAAPGEALSPPDDDGCGCSVPGRRSFGALGGWGIHGVWSVVLSTPRSRMRVMMKRGIAWVGDGG